MTTDFLEQVLFHIHNWFDYESVDVSGIAGGRLPEAAESMLMDGQWYRLDGSRMSDGLHRHPADDLTDEDFVGKVTALAIPKALIAAAQEAFDWDEANAKASAKAMETPYQSESFDGYSYSKGSIGDDGYADGGLTGWQARFASRLNPWRKIG